MHAIGHARKPADTEKETADTKRRRKNALILRACKVLRHTTQQRIHRFDKDSRCNSSADTVAATDCEQEMSAIIMIKKLSFHFSRIFAPYCPSALYSVYNMYDAIYNKRVNCLQT